jgi:hypothetical protein
MGGTDFLHLAVRLSGGATEAQWRSAVSRAYYGAFHLARDFVESCGVTLPKTAEAHDKLQWCLAQVRSQSDFAETRVGISEYALSTLRLPVKESD